MKSSELFRMLKKEGWYPVSGRNMENTIKMIVEKTDTGFSAYSSDHLIFTTGKSVSELMSNAYEAAELYFEEESVKLNPNDMMFEVDFQRNAKDSQARGGVYSPSSFRLTETVSGSKT